MTPPPKVDQQLPQPPKLRPKLHIETTLAGIEQSSITIHQPTRVQLGVNQPLETITLTLLLTVVSTTPKKSQRKTSGLPLISQSTTSLKSTNSFWRRCPTPMTKRSKRELSMVSPSNSSTARTGPKSKAKLVVKSSELVKDQRMTGNSRESSLSKKHSLPKR